MFPNSSHIKTQGEGSTLPPPSRRELHLTSHPSPWWFVNRLQAQMLQWPLMWAMCRKGVETKTAGENSNLSTKDHPSKDNPNGKQRERITQIVLPCQTGKKKTTTTNNNKRSFRLQLKRFFCPDAPGNMFTWMIKLVE